MNSLNNCINYLLTGAQHTVFQYMKKNLAQFDITPIQYGVLGCIWEFDMHNPKDIAAHLGVENSTISGILERMENKGLIRRMIDSTDRRYIYIELTDVSRDLEIPVRTVVTEVDRKVLEIFDEEEKAALKNALRRLYMQSIEEIIQI
ncbi:MAG: winged helix-turn-helix transcriptional regulator [Sarcina sp.]|uniref:MarR family winged helix-turn-helix transcriptional regulator n=1 Tax=Sarcina sp. DSM 11001 TaxID=1798184 RepID=UPI00088CF054|nr:MarR family winged helix-turn-helix transcriptional regulator [Sarcina sp. DSM 11001]MBE6001534.1 winged helix-turn-helix transcriptional regulator [Sarcina sp.]SDL61312.1 DNA-binding transcriptional regulator, MarR family [Sarcina sp. DSM 11001]